MESGLRVRHQESFPPPQGLLLCGNAQLIGVQETPCVGMNRLVICIYVDQQRGKDAALWKAILLSSSSARLLTMSKQKKSSF